MSSIPYELVAIRDRLRRLSAPVLPPGAFDFARAAEGFRLISLNPLWKEAASGIAKEMETLLEACDSKKYRLFERVEEWNQYVSVESGTYVFKDPQTGIVYELPELHPETKELIATDEDRRQWYNSLRTEFTVYTLLIKETLKKDGKENWMDPDLAARVRNIEIGEKQFIATDQSSQDDFVRFFSDRELLEAERQRMNIKIGCPVGLFAYTYTELYKARILPISLSHVGKQGVFYNGTTKLSAKRLAADLSKEYNAPHQHVHIKDYVRVFIENLVGSEDPGLTKSVLQ